jgi:uncharacterized protein YprB with RNaseH-like and TPR domain
LTAPTLTASKVDRLSHAVRVHAAASSPSAPPATEQRPHDPYLRQTLGIDTLDTPHGPVFVRDDWYAPDHAHGALPLSAALEAPMAALAQLLPAPARRANVASVPNRGTAASRRVAAETGCELAERCSTLRPSRLAFFDIETTGLSGGSGTYVVLAGLGSFEPDGFRLRQYFLADVAHERAMLTLLAGDLARFDGIVTYNGRAFDVPVVDARFAMAHVPSPCAALALVDLLHAVRRLYRHRLPGCRLAEAERRLLRIERLDDIPGSLIPSLYFDYVRHGRIAPLRPVFRHNADDVLSLAGILARVVGLLTSDGLDPSDAVAVARWRERMVEPERALPLYRSALPWLEGGEDYAWAATRCARLLRRTGARDEAAAIWSKLWDAGDQASGLELAKHYEHHGRDVAAAEAITLALIAAQRGTAAPGCDLEALELRLARIRRKGQSLR